MKVKPTLVAILVLVSLPIGAQVAVQSPEKARTVEYASPMTLELPLTIGAKLARGSSVAVQSEDLSKFVCEAVSIRMLRLEATKTRKGAGLKFVVNVYNDGSHDKKADIVVEILDGDKKVATASRRNIDAEEGKQREREFTSTTDGPLPVEGILRVTMTVRPD